MERRREGTGSFLVKQWNELSREDLVFPKNRSDNCLQEFKKHSGAILGQE